MKNTANYANSLQKTVFLHCFHFLSRRREAYPRYILAIIAAAITLAISCLIVTAFHPAAGEIVTGIVIIAGSWTLGFGSVFFALIIMRGFQRSAALTWESLLKNSENEKPALPAGQSWQAPEVAPDCIIALQGGETAAEFAARAEEKIGKATRAKWVVVMPFRFPVFHIYSEGGQGETYRRDEPIFARPEWPDFSGQIAESGTVFTSETPDEYRAYVERFAGYFREWAPRVKAEKTAGRGGNIPLEIIKASANILLFLLLSFSAASAQSKCRQVDEALGTRIREIPARGADVSFIFDTKTYNRTGDGVSDYTALLQKSPGLSSFNDKGGRLISITKDGETIAKGAGTEATAERVNTSPSSWQPDYSKGDPRPRKIAPGGVVEAPEGITGEASRFSLPDSAGIASGFDRAKKEWDYRQTEIWQAVKPVWRLIMYFFLSIIPLFIALIGLFNYISGTAANEGFYGLSWIGDFIRKTHEMASGATLVICWGITLVLLIDEFMLFVYSGVSLFWMLVAWIPSVWIAKRLTNWITPNPPSPNISERLNFQTTGQRRIGA